MENHCRGHPSEGTPPSRSIREGSPGEEGWKSGLKGQVRVVNWMTKGQHKASSRKSMALRLGRADPGGWWRKKGQALLLSVNEVRGLGLAPELEVEPWG